MVHLFLQTQVETAKKTSTAMAHAPTHPGGPSSHAGCSAGAQPGGSSRSNQRERESPAWHRGDLNQEIAWHFGKSVFFDEKSIDRANFKLVPPTQGQCKTAIRPSSKSSSKPLKGTMCGSTFGHPGVSQLRWRSVCK